MLSRYRYLLNGNEPQVVVLSNVEQHSWLGYYVSPPAHFHWRKDTGSGEMEPVSEQTVEFKVSRTVGLGVHEDIDITNFTQEPTLLTLVIEIDADFADQAETDKRQQRGKLTRSWKRRGRRGGELKFDYRTEHHYDHQGNAGMAHLHRGMMVRIEKADSPPDYRDRRLIFEVPLEALGHWHTCIKFFPEFAGEKMTPLYECRDFGMSNNVLDRKRRHFLTNSTHIETGSERTLADTVSSALERSKSDLAALRLFDMDGPGGGWVMAAGLPLYIALFGRDTLTVSWQTATLTPELMRGTLHELPKWQGLIENDWRDEQPGRILHEAHTGPLAFLRFNPRSRYYGAATTSSFYPVVLSELWHWTGDKRLIAPLIEPALKGLEWQDRYTKRGDFYEYQTHSSQGNKNQGWKDSEDAIVYEDGSQVDTPISTCEEQGFIYVAKQRMSQLLHFMGDRDLARRLSREARELRKQFNDRFWMPEKKFYALGLDPQRRQIRSIASNPGHLLAAGIIPQNRAALIADRILKPDMFSGWGVRTLSADHPAYDPYSYHRGSVWPVEHGSFAMGMMRYGLIRQLHTMAKALFEASALFDFYRLPECFSGHQRDAEHPFPALYPKANWPQAWSASSLFSVMQAILGIYPFAYMNTLFVDPHLPDWLPEITVSNLHVGNARCSLRFYRKRERTHFDVLEKRGKLHILRQPSPWSLTAGLGERVEDLIESLVAAA